ncbi:MAG: hypothetical protein WBI17_13550 [Clostridiaceae bacterium]
MIVNLLSTLELLPQECGGEYKFSSAIYMTRGFLNAFQNDAETIVIQSLELIRSTYLNDPLGADYLQVFLCGNIRFWIIDDISAITCLLPEEY